MQTEFKLKIYLLAICGSIRDVDWLMTVLKNVYSTMVWSMKMREWRFLGENNWSTIRLSLEINRCEEYNCRCFWMPSLCVKSSDVKFALHLNWLTQTSTILRSRTHRWNLESYSLKNQFYHIFFPHYLVRSIWQLKGWRPNKMDTDVRTMKRLQG